MNLDWSSVKSLSIPVGGIARDVKRVSVGGVTVWEKQSQNPYITDGLIAWWDGIWNAGTNQHSAAATSWKDLAGNNNIDINKTGVTVSSDRVSFRNSAYIDQTLSGITIKTIEIVCAGYATADTTQGAIYSNSGWKLQFRIDTKLAGWGVAGGYNPTYWSGPGAAGKVFGAAFTCDGSTRKEYFAGSLFKTRSNSGNIPSNNIKFGRDSNGKTESCDILCVRLYNRVLTATEIASNYAADNSRFSIASASLLSSTPSLSLEPDTP